MQSVDLKRYVPHFELEVGGDTKMGEIIRSSTISISVREEFSQIASFTFVVADHFHVDRQEFTWLDSDALKPGKTIKIKLGYTNNLVDIIEGQISTTTSSGFTSEPPRLTVNGFHKGHKALTQPSSGNEPIRLEKEDTYSRIAEKLRDSINLKKDEDSIDKTEKYAPIIMKKPIVYSDFLKEKAKRVGYEFFVTRGTLFFIDPRKNKRIAQGVVFEWGTNIVQFVPSINTAELVSEVELRGHAPDSKEKIVVNVTEEDAADVVEKGKKTGSQIAREIDPEKKGKKKDIKDQIVSSEKEGRDLARAEMNSASDKLITASLSIIGDPKLMPGQIIEIKRVGRTFSGRYFVTQATHTIDSNGYTTTLNVRRNVM